MFDDIIDLNTPANKVRLAMAMHGVKLSGFHRPLGVVSVARKLRRMVHTTVPAEVVLEKIEALEKQEAAASPNRHVKKIRDDDVVVDFDIPEATYLTMVNNDYRQILEVELSQDEAECEPEPKKRSSRKRQCV